MTSTEEINRAHENSLRDLWDQLYNEDLHNKRYFDYPVIQYQILHNIFYKNNVKRVKLIGGATALDFFIAQYGNDVEYCLCIDKNSEYRGQDLEVLHDKYSKEFHYKGKFDFKQIDAADFNEELLPFDLVIDSTNETDTKHFYNCEIYIKNHYRKIHRWSLMQKIGYYIPMRFATFHSCFYSKKELDIKYDLHRGYERSMTTLTSLTTEVPVIYPRNLD